MTTKLHHKYLLRTMTVASFALATPLTAFAQQAPTVQVPAQSGQSAGVTAQAPTQSAPSASSYAPASNTAAATAEDGPISVAPPDSAPQAAAPNSTSDSDSGTTIVGDKEAPIGLYITPWKDEYAQHGLDRPARFVDVDTSPIDPDVFQRRINYYNVITDYREAHLSSGK